MIIAKESGADGVYAADLGGLYLAKEIGIENIAVDYLFNVYNDPARYYRNVLTLAVMSAALVFASFLLIRRNRYDSI